MRVLVVFCGQNKYVRIAVAVCMQEQDKNVNAACCSLVRFRQHNQGARGDWCVAGGGMRTSAAAEGQREVM